MKDKITVADALARLNAGHSIAALAIDFADTSIEALDVMKLAKAGKITPAENVYYDDDDIVHDEAFEGNWKEIDFDPVDALKDDFAIKIHLKEDVKGWIISKNIKVEELVETLLDSFYRSQKIGNA